MAIIVQAPDKYLPSTGESLRCVYHFSGSNPVESKWPGAVALQVGNNPYLKLAGYTYVPERRVVVVDVYIKALSATRDHNTVEALMSSTRLFTMSATVSASLVSVWGITSAEITPESRKYVGGESRASVWGGPSPDAVDYDVPNWLDIVGGTIKGTATGVVDLVTKVPEKIHTAAREVLGIPPWLLVGGVLVVAGVVLTRGAK